MSRPVSPLPAIDGLDPVRVCTPSAVRGIAPPWLTLLAWLEHRLPDHVDVASLVADGRFFLADGSTVAPDDTYRPATCIWFHRPTPTDEPRVPGELVVLHRDDRLVVVDKPPFMATIPRGRHVRQTVVVRLRDELSLPELAPAHRLDRLTSGIVVLTTSRRWRGNYQRLFQDRQVLKTYLALVRHDPSIVIPDAISSHLRKDRGVWQVRTVAGAEPNAHTVIESVDVRGGEALVRLRPLTGKTHQLRVHLASLGLPIIGDPLYPVRRDVASDDFSMPLQLLAHEIAFTDPIDHTQRLFTSARSLPLRRHG